MDYLGEIRFTFTDLSPAILPCFTDSASGSAFIALNNVFEEKKSRGKIPELRLVRFDVEVELSLTSDLSDDDEVVDVEPVIRVVNLADLLPALQGTGVNLEINFREVESEW